ncbi:unnamed protein product [marine sediment metagenome]|uniref:LiaI-LiaF-like transmembrane region domain-containing protein n=1 Tax=marine sediment metagenome TaxID=412755 RepID=X1DNE2_9ZZZZ
MKANKMIKGLSFLLIGTILLANTLEILEWSVWSNIIKLWPLLIVSLGLSLIFRGKSLSFMGPLIIFLGIIAGVGASYVGISFEGEMVREVKTLSREIVIEVEKIPETETALETEVIPEIETVPETEISPETEVTLETKEYLEIEKEADILIYHSPVTKKVISSNIKNNWQLKLNNKIIYDLSIKTGAIDIDCDLSDFKVEKLYIESGASNINLVLLQYDSNIIIDTGVSNINIAIPKNVGATVNIDSGIAIKDLDDFIKRNGAYISNNYNSSEFKVEIEIDCGVSNIDIDYIDIP